MKRSLTAGTLAFGIGVIVWIAIRLVAGSDPVRAGSLYLWFGWPAIVLGSFALGWAAPVRPWRWPVAMLGTEAVLRATAGGGVRDPREMVLLVLLALPCLAAAWLGATAGGTGVADAPADGG